MSRPILSIDIATFVASLATGHDDLKARIRTLTHSTKCKDGLIEIHGHFLAFRDGQPTVSEFTNILSTKLVPFCLHRKYIDDAQKDWGSMTSGKVHESAVRLHLKALDLFKRACRKTNRNGEFGELITYLLIESVLKAPQFVAKMSLKTNSEMPIHGSDGIHLGYDDKTGKLSLYWGESKCYASVTSAINEGIKSIAENLKHEKMGHELFLVEQYFDLSGFPQSYRDAILSFLDPFDENYNKRADVSVVFIAFNFAAFAAMNNLDPDDVEAEFSTQFRTELENFAVHLDNALAKHNVKKHSIEVFFLPVPSVDKLRSLFQDNIGWSS